MKALLVLLLAVAALGGCGLGRADYLIVDDLSVGEPCEPCLDPRTGENLAALASRGIDEQWPGHPPIVTLSMHHEGSYPGPSGELLQPNRSGALFVGLATFADGTRHAVGVYCGVDTCRPAW
jgi:hypothetical protein